MIPFTTRRNIFWILLIFILVSFIYFIVSDEDSLICKHSTLCIIKEKHLSMFRGITEEKKINESTNTVLVVDSPTKTFPSSTKTFPSPTKTLPTTTESPLEWLDLTEGRKYADYGDGSCGGNSYRPTLAAIFKRWTELAKANNISYFIFAGTLLGAWRNEDIIPYDTDMDLLVDRADGAKVEAITSPRTFSGYDSNIHLAIQVDWRLPSLQRRRVRCDGAVVPSMNDECSFQEPLARLIKSGTHLDIYDYYFENGTMYELSDFKKTMNPADVWPLKRCRFLGVETFCPNNPPGTLRLFYGDNFHPPKKCKNGNWV